MLPNQRRGKKAYRFGKWAETIARLFLLVRGYSCLYQGFRLSFVEVDLILTKKNTLIFCEVKKRASFLKAGESIKRVQKEHLLKGARLFLKMYPQFQNHDIRFDAILLEPWKLPRHVKHAWDETYF